MLGAFGSQKTEFAEKLAHKMSSEGDENCIHCPILIVDDYAEEAEEASDLAMGMAASYIGNLYVMLWRWAKERRAERDGAKTIITCGTMIDTSVYESIHAVSGGQPQHYIRTQNFMHLAGTFFQDTFEYDHLFLMPQPEGATSYQQKIHFGLFQALEAFSAPYVVLEEQDVDKRVKEALDVLQDSDH